MNVFAERTGLPLEAAEVMVVDVGGVVLSSESCGAGCFAFNARDHVSVTVRVAGFNSMQRDSAFEAECGRVVGQRWDVALSEVGSGAESEVTFSTFAMPCAGMD